MNDEILTMRQIKLRAIKAALVRSNGDMRAAAKELAIGRTTIYRVMRGQKAMAARA